MITLDSKDLLNNLQDVRNLVELTAAVSDQNQRLSLINATILLLDTTINDIEGILLDTPTQGNTSPV